MTTFKFVMVHKTTGKVTGPFTTINAVPKGTNFDHFTMKVLVLDLPVYGKII